jgi:ferritin-like metal-binding protein YciE
VGIGELPEALEELEQQTSNVELANAFAKHRSETEGHIERLDVVFKMVDHEPEIEECEGVEGLLKGLETFVQYEQPGERLFDIPNQVAGQQSEHYEVAAYGNVTLFADRLGMDEAGDLLDTDLEEEQSALVDVYNVDQISEEG